MDNRTFTRWLLGQLRERPTGQQPLAAGARAISLGEYRTLSKNAHSGVQSGVKADPATPLKPRERRMVVTRQDVLTRGADQGVWMLPDDAIITPMARDTAKQLGIRLQRAP